MGAGKYLQRRRKKKKANRLLRHETATLHYIDAASERPQRQKITNNSITPVNSSPPLGGAHPFWSQTSPILYNADEPASKEPHVRRRHR